MQTVAKEGVVHRLVEIVREIESDHLTNWGPYTKFSLPNETLDCVLHPIGTLNLFQRRRLEEIGAQEPVRVPDGTWNCQDWVISVLRKAEQAGLFGREQWQSAVCAAGWTGEL